MLDKIEDRRATTHNELVAGFVCACACVCVRAYVYALFTRITRSTGNSQIMEAVEISDELYIGSVLYPIV